MSTIIEVRVGASTDDAYRRLTADYWSLTNVANPAGHGSVTAYQYGCGMRFLNITIPQGATIDTAYMIFKSVYEDHGSIIKTRISAEDVDNAVTFADNSSTFDTRWAARTTARVDWDDIPWWDAAEQGADTTSPEIKTVIQEVIDRDGWSSGNAIVIFWEDFENRTGNYNDARRRAYSYDGSADDAPLIHIEYTYEAPSGWTGKFCGTTNPAKINGVAVASIANVNGVG
jgi:hypothetical protein